MPAFTEPPYVIIEISPIANDWTGARFIVCAPEGAPGGLVAIMGGLGEAEERANAHLCSAAGELFNGCNALIGLIQLVCSRKDMPPQIKEALETSHRLAEALAAVSLAEKGTYV
jgi:hypothetical protein